jgi:hypothetical protein
MIFGYGPRSEIWEWAGKIGGKDKGAAVGGIAVECWRRLKENMFGV